MQLRLLRSFPLAALCTAGLLASATPVNTAAQTVSPPVAEYRERARSSFLLTNASLFPLSVVLEVRGFDVTEDGEVVDVPLDTTRVHIRLSATSFRIPPRGASRVFYEATGDSLPAWFQILSAISGARTASGINLRIVLPHVVYLNQKDGLKREDVAIRAFDFDSAAGMARVELENTSDRLGRVLELNIRDSTKYSLPAGAFPLFPHQRRRVALPWASPNPPDKLQIRFARFGLDTVRTPPAAAGQ
jgi:hypothetical protein